MSLQDAFYVVAIIFMTLMILLFIVGIAILFYIKNRITEISRTIQVRINQAKEVMTHPKEFAAQLGSAMVDKALDTLGGKKNK